jgi:hypothetical protein
MPYFRIRRSLIGGFAVLILLGGCEPKAECDSPETRDAVLKTIQDNHTNALASYAAKKSNVAKDVDTSANSERAKPLYLLGEKIVTTSTTDDKRTLKCSGAISAIVGDTKASKEVTFTVQRPPKGEISVSVDPFEF